MKNWKTTVSGIGAALTSLLAIVAIIPAQMGNLSTMIPESSKHTLFIVCAIAGVLLKCINSVYQQDATTPVSNPAASSIVKAAIVILLAGITVLILQACSAVQLKTTETNILKAVSVAETNAPKIYAAIASAQSIAVLVEPSKVSTPINSALSAAAALGQAYLGQTIPTSAFNTGNLAVDKALATTTTILSSKITQADINQLNTLAANANANIVTSTSPALSGS